MVGCVCPPGGAVAQGVALAGRGAGLGEELHLVLQAPTGFLGPLTPPHLQLLTSKQDPESHFDPTESPQNVLLGFRPECVAAGAGSSLPGQGPLPHLFFLPDLPLPLR